MITRSSARSWTRRPSARRAGAACAAAVAAGSLLTSAGLAAAEPQPTISQVQKKLNQLRSQEDQAIQQYDQTQQELASARQRMAAVSRHLHRHRAQFQAARTQIAQLAAAAYENGGMTSIPALVTSNDPNTVIDQSAILNHVSTIQTAQIQHLVTSARQLTSAQQHAARTERSITQLEQQQRARKDAILAAMARAKRLLSRLTAAQKAALAAAQAAKAKAAQAAQAAQTAQAAPTASSSGTSSGSTSSQASQAVSFAYAQLGKPYVFGATGPNSYDCSGLVQAAWASAGVSIPRTTYEQWASLPHVPMSSIQPGDLIFFEAEGHVGIYVGNNMLIDAPQPGMTVEKVSLSNVWYASNLDGAARP